MIKAPSLFYFGGIKAAYDTWFINGGLTKNVINNGGLMTFPSPSFPSSFSVHGFPSDLFFLPDVCSLRLDFESFTIQGTGNTAEGDTNAGTNGGVCLDSFSVTVSMSEALNSQK